MSAVNKRRLSRITDKDLERFQKNLRAWRFLAQGT